MSHSPEVAAPPSAAVPPSVTEPSTPVTAPAAVPENLAEAQADLDAYSAGVRERANALAPSTAAPVLFSYSGNCSGKYWTFRLDETESLASMFAPAIGRNVIDRSKMINDFTPFVFAHDELSDAEASRIMERSTTLRGVYRVLARATTEDGLVEALAKSVALAGPAPAPAPADSTGADVPDASSSSCSSSSEAGTETDPTLPYLRSSLHGLINAASFRVDMHCINRTASSTEKAQLRARLIATLSPRGRVNPVVPERRAVVYIDNAIPEELPPGPAQGKIHLLNRVGTGYYFCVPINEPYQPFWSKYNLSSRPYIGPTSTDAQLAFLMANFARVTPSSMVLDPFVGTGSILLASAALGAAAVGQDLDWKVIHGRMKGKKATIFDNFKHYGLKRPELVCGDMAHPIWRWAKSTTDPTASAAPAAVRRSPGFDAIVCDPPYGIRAGARRLAPLKGPSYALNPAAAAAAGIDVGAAAPDGRGGEGNPLPNVYVPNTEVYPVQEVVLDMLHMAALALPVGGRICYLLPTPKKGWKDEDLPTHPCLTVVYSCNQTLQGEFTRRAVTMEKHREVDVVADSAWVASVKQGEPPRWATLHDEVMIKENGTVKGKGKIHYTKATKKAYKEARLAKGLPAKYVPEEILAKRARVAAAEAEAAAAAEAEAAAASAEAGETGSKMSDDEGKK